MRIYLIKNILLGPGADKLRTRLPCDLEHDVACLNEYNVPKFYEQEP